MLSNPVLAMTLLRVSLGEVQMSSQPCLVQSSSPLLLVSPQPLIFGVEQPLFELTDRLLESFSSSGAELPS